VQGESSRLEALGHRIPSNACYILCSVACKLFFDKEIDLTPYLEKARSVCQLAVKEIQTRVGRTEDIRAIILAGGGSALYVPAIRAAFPRTPIHALSSPCFANVSGFYDIGSTRPVKQK
jgi:plasmid segregation protein ParM